MQTEAIHAQAGDLKDLQKQLPDLLIAGEDLPDICDAYVRGCILMYRLQEAHAVLELWKKDVPEDPQVYFLSGRLLDHQSNLVEAESEFRTALEKSKHHAPAAYNLARLLVGKHQYKEAIPFFELTNKSLNQQQPGLIGIAECYLHLGDYDKTREFLEQAIKQDDKELKPTYRYLGDSGAMSGARLASVYGQLEAASGNDQQAINWYEIALQANRFDFRTRYKYSLALKKVGRKEDSQKESELFLKTREALAKCDPLITRIKNSPTDIEARFELGKLMLEHVSEYQGLVWLKSVFEYDPHHSPTQELLEDYFQDKK